MDSVWTQTVQLPRFETLKQPIRTDVLIIGGGICGLLCAYRLSRAGIRSVLVEQNRLLDGNSKNTTAKITAQHGLIYHRLLRRFGFDTTRLYLNANLEALEQYRRLCREIDCDFEEQSSFVYSLHDRKIIEQELAALRAIGFSAHSTTNLPLPFPVAGAIEFPGQAQFHPLKFSSAICKDLQIYEHTKVVDIKEGQAITENAVISADKIVVATHFPFRNLHGAYFLKLYQHRSYVLALKNAPPLHGMYVDEAEGGLSFRPYGDLLLLGGAGHRTGKRGGAWRELESVAQKYYPQAQISARWAAQDCMTLDSVPYIGLYSDRTPNLYVASGFNKWGMTSSMVAATLLCDLIQGKENPCQAVFSPSRRILRPQLAVNLAESALHFFTPFGPRCPHMGCKLKYNAEEQSWDCPCHGSRFTKEGRLIDNPATDNKKP